MVFGSVHRRRVDGIADSRRRPSGGVCWCAITELRKFSGGLRLRYLGPRPIVEDASVQAKRSRLVNAEAGYRVAPGTRLVIDLLNLFDAQASDIDYYYSSRLPGESADGVEDIHTHPVAPRTARVSVRFYF